MSSKQQEAIETQRVIQILTPKFQQMLEKVSASTATNADANRADFNAFFEQEIEASIIESSRRSSKSPRIPKSLKPLIKENLHRHFRQFTSEMKDYFYKWMTAPTPKLELIYEFINTNLYIIKWKDYLDLFQQFRDAAPTLLFDATNLDALNLLEFFAVSHFDEIDSFKAFINNTDPFDTDYIGNWNTFLIKTLENEKHHPFLLNCIEKMGLYIPPEMLFQHLPLTKKDAKKVYDSYVQYLYLKPNKIHFETQQFYIYAPKLLNLYKFASDHHYLKEYEYYTTLLIHYQPDRSIVPLYSRSEVNCMNLYRALLVFQYGHLSNLIDKVFEKLRTNAGANLESIQSNLLRSVFFYYIDQDDDTLYSFDDYPEIQEDVLMRLLVETGKQLREVRIDTEHDPGRMMPLAVYAAERDPPNIRALVFFITKGYTFEEDAQMVGIKEEAKELLQFDFRKAVENIKNAWTHYRYKPTHPEQRRLGKLNWDRHLEEQEAIFKKRQASPASTEASPKALPKASTGGSKRFSKKK